MPAPLDWSPADHDANIGVTWAVATRSSALGAAWALARCDMPQTTGIRYVEFTIINVGSGGMMLGVSGSALNISTYAGSDTNGVSYWSGGQVYKNAAFVGTVVATYTTGDVIGMQVDLDARTVKFRKNAGAFSATVDISSLGADVYVTASLNATGADASVRAEAHIAYPLGASAWNDQPSRTATTNIVAAGDSITLNGGAARPYLPRLVALAGDVHWSKAGINGASWAYAWPSSGLVSSLTGDAAGRVDNRIEAGKTNWLIAFAGTNGIILNGNSAATEYTALQAYVNARVSAGWSASKIVLCTMLPRTGLSEATRTAYNAAIVADAGAIGYKVARLDSNASIGAAGQNLNTTWFIDGTHPTDAGQALIAQIIYAVMFP